MADNDTNKLGTYHISTGIQNYETARSNFFTFIVEDLDDLLYPEFSYTGSNEDNEYVTRSGPTGSGADEKKVKSGKEIIKLSVNKMFVPHFNLGKIEIKRGNSSVNFADTPTWQSGTLECQDFVGLETKNVLMAWQALAYDVNSDTQGRAGDWTEEVTDETGKIIKILHKGYKRNCQLVEYTPDFKQVRYWDLIGCWISQITESSFEVDGTGGRSLSCQIEYDRAYMHMPSEHFSK